MDKYLTIIIALCLSLIVVFTEPTINYFKCNEQMRPPRITYNLYIPEKITTEVIKESKEKTKPKLSGNLTRNKIEKPQMVAGSTDMIYTAAQFRSLGVFKWGGNRWTWYSQRVLPGGGLSIPGRCISNDGYICDENGYICVASQDLPKGTIINTPLGRKGKVYDWCGVHGTIDVYTNW